MGRYIASGSKVAFLLVVHVLLYDGTPAIAQIRGLPVHFSPSARPGLALHADFGIGDDPLELFGGGRAMLNLSYVTFNFGAGYTRNADFVWGGTAAANLLRGAKRDVSLSLDAGYGENSVQRPTGAEDRQEIPIGLGLALEPTLTGAELEPWFGARAHLRRSTLDGAGSATEVGVGISAGVNARTSALTHIGIPIPNFGLHVAIDYLTIPEAFREGRDGTFTLSIGISHLIPFEGLPDDGIIPPKCSPFDPCP